MTLNRSQLAHIARIEASRDIVAQAAAEHRARQLVLTTDARILRLFSRAATHRARGRMQAARATLRMAKRLIATIPE